MSLPEPIKQLLFQFAARFPVPTGQPGDEHEDNVRQWTMRFCQQVAFSFPNQGYGGKSSAPGYPFSKDSLAKQSAAFGLESWDLLLGVGTGNPQLAQEPQYHHIPGQVFVPVEPVNHLGVVVPPVPEPQPIPQPQPVPPACKANDAAAEVLDALHEMRLENAERYDAIRSQLHRLEVAAARARKVRGKVSWSGQIDGEVSGVQV